MHFQAARKKLRYNEIVTELPQGYMHDTPSFPAWLRLRRHALGLTQHALAARAACSASLLRKYEAGERRRLELQFACTT